MASKNKASGTVLVYANLPHGQQFRLPDGRSVVINGFPVSRLSGPDGARQRSGRYGVTVLPAADWEAVQRHYGAMRIFTSGLVFAAPDADQGDAMAAERDELRHGLEQADPEHANTKPAKAEV